MDSRAIKNKLLKLQKRTKQTSVTLYALVVTPKQVALGDLVEIGSYVLKHSLLTRFAGNRIESIVIAPQKRLIREWIKRKKASHVRLWKPEGNSETYACSWSKGLRIPIASFPNDLQWEKITRSLMKGMGQPFQVMITVEEPTPIQQRLYE